MSITLHRVREIVAHEFDVAQVPFADVKLVHRHMSAQLVLEYRDIEVTIATDYQLVQLGKRCLPELAKAAALKLLALIEEQKK